jgi:hypothetical protein
MLIIQGSPKLTNPEKYIRRHRVMGWIFVVLFLVMFIFMIERIGEYWEESSARISLHIALSLALLILIAVKVTLPRYYPRLNKHLFALGITIYAAAFSLVGITGGYYVARIFRDIPHISHSTLTEHMLDLELGKEMFITECSTCHSLDRIMAFRSPESWVEVVNEMVALAEPRINPDEAQQILHYLLETHVPVPFEGTGEATLVDKHCLPCHDAQDIYDKSFTRVGWTEVVMQMHEYSPEIVPEDKIDEIVDFLLENQAK